MMCCCPSAYLLSNSTSGSCEFLMTTLFVLIVFPTSWPLELMVLRRTHTTHQPIKGLYAGGEIVGGVHGASRLGTVAVIDALTFGMIAGEQFAAMVKKA